MNLEGDGSPWMMGSGLTGNGRSRPGTRRGARPRSRAHTREGAGERQGGNGHGDVMRLRRGVIEGCEARCGKGHRVLVRQLAVGRRLGTPETHRTPGPESGCNKPEDLDAQTVEAGKNRTDGTTQEVGTSCRRQSFGRVGNVERGQGETVEGHTRECQERRDGASRLGIRTAPRRRSQDHGGRVARFSTNRSTPLRECLEGQVR